MVDLERTKMAGRQIERDLDAISLDDPELICHVSSPRENHFRSS